MLNIERYKMEEQEKWTEWCKSIPSFNFPKNWNVQIIPPFLCAMVRFVITLPENPNIRVSVYLDVNESLGFFGGKPYWEIYPDACDDNMRFDLNDTAAMMKAIASSLRKQKSNLAKASKTTP